MTPTRKVVGSTTSATDELRRLLDERGVEYLASEDDTTIYYADSGYRYTYNVNHDSGWAQLYGYNLTPEQAIAATLGPTDPSERGLIPHFWTSDWTLHVETERLPERIDVTLPDQRGREVYSARIHRFVPERTCRNTAPSYLDFLCSECGFVHYHSDENDSGDNEWHFCPNCGAKVDEVGDEK